MASVLYVEESVVTGDILVNIHSEEEEVCVVAPAELVKPEEEEVVAFSLA